MNWKWLQNAELYEANVDGPGDGGGSSISEGVDSGAGDEAPSAEPRGEEGSPEPSSTPSAEPKAAPTESKPIAFPNALSSIFAPRPDTTPATTQDHHPAAPQTPAGQPAPVAGGPAKPDRSLAVTDPEAYAAQLEAYYDAKIETAQKTAVTPVEELRSEIQKEREAQWRHAFETAKRTAQTSLPRHWDNILAKDSDFNTNPDLQAAVQDIIGYFVAGKIKEGDIDGLHLAADPKFVRRALLIAKDELGVGRSPSYRPGGGPGLVGPQGQATPGPRLVDDETRAAIAEADKEGYRYSEEQIAKALKRRNT